MAITLLVVDDHPVVVQGLSQLLEGNGMEVVATASTADDAVRAARKTKPDVAVLDVRMPDKDGFAALEKLRTVCPGTAIVMFSGYDNPTYVARAVAAGAHDYIMKDAPPKELFAAIKAAAEGTPPAKFSALKRVATSMADRSLAEGPSSSLTPRESQVLRQIALGLSNKEIAQSLAISIETVKEHVQNLLRKLAVNDRTQAAVWAIRNGVA